MSTAGYGEEDTLWKSTRRRGLRVGRGKSWEMEVGVAMLVLVGRAVLANGMLIDELDAMWVMRRGTEAEVLVAANLVAEMGKRVVDLVAKPGERCGDYRSIYVNAGRAILLADGIQAHVLELLSYKGGCGSCLKRTQECD